MGFDCFRDSDRLPKQVGGVHDTQNFMIRNRGINHCSDLSRCPSTVRRSSPHPFLPTRTEKGSCREILILTHPKDISHTATDQSCQKLV